MTMLNVSWEWSGIDADDTLVAECPEECTRRLHAGWSAWTKSPSAFLRRGKRGSL